ncbi:hypothetical protein CcI49_32845 [Frankia sp. CcI49]|uniref:hypothetical protein n=1 Tax=Frankia sp. CcI49 TaxID=1745382 RepID=UPI0009763537|nr:hypothetical protein [Frankia sp. CcI49]ONH52920.1 hypothetical protein CcI49_32845 [Frankia sp. CcI49]
MPKSKIDQLVAGYINLVTTAMSALDWAEEEITQAIARHPRKRDQLFHSYPALVPTTILFPVEFVYRGHFREILERVATGKDARPGTAAEACCLLTEVSKSTPFPSYGYGLYFRLWAKAFPDHATIAADSQIGHYEALFGPKIDELEGDIRKDLTVQDRQLGPITCDGVHNGVIVDCAYTRTR